MITSWFLPQVSIEYPKYRKNFILTPSRQAMAKALGRRKHHSFAKHAVHDIMTRSYIVKHLGKIIKGELRNLCSSSILLNKDRKALSTFNWDDIIQECQCKSPVLYGLFEYCLPKAMGLDSQVIVGTCICVLAKARRSSASLLQRIVSLILYQGHAGKQVSFYSLECVTWHLYICG